LMLEQTMPVPVTRFGKHGERHAAFLCRRTCRNSLTSNPAHKP
jgi:hypothetical protein